jgi:hypothetical protein
MGRSIEVGLRVAACSTTGCAPWAGATEHFTNLLGYPREVRLLFGDAAVGVELNREKSWMEEGTTPQGSWPPSGSGERMGA